MIDKDYCMSSYLAFRYIERDDVDFYEGMHHKNIQPIPEIEKISTGTAEEIGRAIEAQLTPLRDTKKVGVMLSGGMDSAIVASFVPGADAYTFRFLGGEFQKEELARAEYYAKYYNLHLHYVDISWDTVERHIDAVMEAKCAPVHSIEPQILQAALQAKEDGVEITFQYPTRIRCRDLLIFILQTGMVLSVQNSKPTLICPGVRVVYFPYTKGTSSTILNETLNKLRV